MDVLEICLAVRDGSGRAVDLVEVGFDALVEVIRVRPPGEPPGAFGVSVDVLEAVDRPVGQATALRAAAVAAVADDIPGGSGSDHVRDEVAAALGVSRRSAGFLSSSAETMRCHPRVWAALWSGDLDATRARIAADALFFIPEHDEDGVVRESYGADYDRLLAAGLAFARDHTARQLDRYLQRLLAQLDPACVRRRRVRALTERGLWLGHRGDGTADLTARLAAEDAEKVYAAVRAHALRGGAAPRVANPGGGADSVVVGSEPFDLRMAGAFVDLVLPTSGDDRRAVTTQINVTIPVESLAGLADTPGLLSGYGIIPADLARRLAAGDARWRHILTHRITDAVLDVGRWSYRPPPAMARHVRLRDGTCRFPGCLVPATECDLDHLIPFPAGPTSADNLHTLCRRHHRLKHDGHWKVEPLPNSGLPWTSSLGTVATTHPDDRLPGAA